MFWGKFGIILMFVIRLLLVCKRVQVSLVLCCHRWILHGSVHQSVDRMSNQVVLWHIRLLAFQNQHPKYIATAWRSRTRATKIFEHRPPFWLHWNLHRHWIWCHLSCWIVSLGDCRVFRCCWNSLWVHCRMHSTGCLSMPRKWHSKLPRCRNKSQLEWPIAMPCESPCTSDTKNKRIHKFVNQFQRWSKSSTHIYHHHWNVTNKTGFTIHSNSVRNMQKVKPKKKNNKRNHFLYTHWRTQYVRKRSLFALTSTD